MVYKLVERFSAVDTRVNFGAVHSLAQRRQLNHALPSSTGNFLHPAHVLIDEPAIVWIALENSLRVQEELVESIFFKRIKFLYELVSPAEAFSW